MEAGEVSIQPTPTAGQPTPAWVSLQPGEVVTARVLAINDDGTITIRLMGSLARLDSDAVVAVAGGLPSAGSVLTLKCIETATAPKLMLIAVLLGIGEGELSAAGPPQSWPLTIETSEMTQFTASGESVDLPPAVRAGIETLAASFRHANLAEARVVVANLVRFAVPVTKENFNAVLDAAGLRGAELDDAGAASGRGAIFAARAKMSAFLLSRGIAPTPEMIAFLVPASGGETAFGLDTGGEHSTPATLQPDAQSFIELLRAQKATQATVVIDPEQVRAMLSSSSRLPLYDVAIQVVDGLLQPPGESAIGGSAGSGIAFPTGLQQFSSHEDALAALLALLDRSGREQRAGEVMHMSLSTLGEDVPKGGESEQALKDAIVAILKGLDRSELQLLFSKLKSAEESEIVRVLNSAGRSLAAQNTVASRNAVLKALDIAASSQLERVAHFQFALPGAAGVCKGRMRISWRDESEGMRIVREPKQIVILLDMSKLGRVLALADFSRPKTVAVRFHVRDRGVRMLIVQSQDELRAALAHIGYTAAISAAVSSEGMMADPFEPQSLGGVRGGVDIKI